MIFIIPGFRKKKKNRNMSSGKKLEVIYIDVRTLSL